MSGASAISARTPCRPTYDVQLSVSASFVANDKMYYMANGVQASYVEVDCETGFIKVLGQWAVDDCGRVINPLLVDEQVRGGIVQGIGAVLYRGMHLQRGRQPAERHDGRLSRADGR